MSNVKLTKDRPLISIIVAVLNGAKTLQHCIDSVEYQASKNHELIIMDGGSTDGTIEILRENNNKIFYWESKPDLGISHAWNRALDHAGGEWIFFLGSDDRFISKTVLESITPDLLLSRNKLLLFGKVLLNGGPLDGLLIGEPWKWSKFQRRMSIPHQAAFHNRLLFEKVGKFDENYRFAADYELLLRAGKTLDPVFVDKIVAVMDGSGASIRNRSKSLREFRNAQIKNKVDIRLKIELWHLLYQARGLMDRLHVE